MSPRPAYRPMARRHKLVFFAAFLGFLALAGAIAFARFRLLAWWFERCDAPTTACRSHVWY